MSPPRIEIHDKFFDDELLIALTRFINSLSWKSGWHSNKAYEFTQWHADFANAGSQNREDVYGRIKTTELLRAWDAIQVKAIRASHKLLRCYANLNVYGSEGYPHRDTDQANAADLTSLVYFCGEDWRLEHGGETALAIDGEIIKSVVPRVNRLLLFPSSMMHVARSVTHICSKPRVTLMFKSTP